MGQESKESKSDKTDNIEDKHKIESYDDQVIPYDPEPYFELLDHYFEHDFQLLIRHHINSFNQLLDETIPGIMQKEGGYVISEKVSENKSIKYRLEFTKVGINHPMTENEEGLMFPIEAIQKTVSYYSKITANVVQYQDIIDLNTGKVESTKIVGQQDDHYITKCPIMVRSKGCNLVNNPELFKNHCKYDMGGYFIINGNEKVVLSTDTMVMRKPLVFIKKEQNVPIYFVEVLSKLPSQTVGSLQKFSIKIKKDGSIVLAIPYFKEISIFTFMRALGIETDEEIMDRILDRDTEKDMCFLVSSCMSKQAMHLTASKTKEEAIEIMMNNLKSTKIFNETDPEIKYQQKKKHLIKILSTYILPHVVSNTGIDTQDMRHKGIYVGYMVHRLLKCYMRDSKEVEENRGCDDRDSMINKRIETSGVLIGTLFDQHFRKMINDLNKMFKSKGVDDKKPPNIIKHIKPTTIEGGLRQALATGSFGGPTKKGLSQPLSRMNILRTLSDLRRTTTPTVDASNNKLTSPRHLHMTHYGYFCPLETPEGAKTGLSKNLSLTSTVTMNMIKQSEKIEKLLIYKKINNLLDSRAKFHKLFKIFLNGNIVGVYKNVIELRDLMRAMRFNGDINRHVSMFINFKDKEFHILTDGGRLIRPLLVVENNQIKFKPDMLQKITNYTEYIEKHPTTVEFMDADESFYSLMLAPYPTYVERSLSIMNRKSITSKDELDYINRTNRYDNNVFVRYTHCEFHPSTVLGAISANIPFPNHNQTTRGILYFSQCKQTMGVYSSDFRMRTDISYIAYHPQLPLIAPRCGKYTGTGVFPTGENTIVAIMSYTGYNQEDNNVMNQSAIEKQFMTAQSFKKEIHKIDRNYSSQMAQFTKPDPTQISHRRAGNYDKLNTKGYADIETRIENGDIIIGLIKPKPQINGDEQPYKDASIEYKSLVPGAVDDVVMGTTVDAYPMIKMRIRAHRVLQIGDKVTSRHGQKNTIGLTLRRFNMPFAGADGLIPDIIINPNCMPRRMTIAQMIEGLLSNVCAIKGMFGDATPFMPVNLVKINKELEALGGESWGYKTMYNGFTGRKLKAKIFMVPIFYHRLKQMVGDKTHSRQRGMVQVLTQQPPEGRARDGGLRIGEMERDSLVGHNAAQFLKEKMMENSDKYFCRVCDVCGLIAHKVPKENYYMCETCKTTTKISTIVIPYAFKLLMQEFKAMHIDGRIRTAKSVT